MSLEKQIEDKAGREYWEHLWTAADLPSAIDLRDRRLAYYVEQRFDAFFRQTFATLGSKDSRLLEVGCARSVWLPYMAKELGFNVAGLDYSETGCEQSRYMLAREGVTGEVVCTDLFAPPEFLVGVFDVVFSLGVVEHFPDTAGCIAAFARYLRPGGMVVTVIPNMVGVMGRLQKWADPAVYAIHVPLDREALAKAHRHSGLEPVFCDYFLFSHLGVVNMEKWHCTFLYSIINEVRFRVSQLLWFLEKSLSCFRANHITSPYVVCVARKPCA
jgi:2-polyprenyl-3-methyl-5-hydroxy-6-metoxy-1,4-benzoquinol methylase